MKGDSSFCFFAPNNQLYLPIYNENVQNVLIQVVFFLLPKIEFNYYYYILTSLNINFYPDSIELLYC